VAVLRDLRVMCHAMLSKNEMSSAPGEIRVVVNPRWHRWA